MNPRHRRLLIPGLLIALLIVVLVSSVVGRAESAETDPVVVSHIDDPRVQESSGLAMSRADDDLAYTINDSDNSPTVYAVRVSTGEVVGATSISGGTLQDTEAIGMGPGGVLWIADTGDNRERRTDVALYALPEPGAGDHSVTAKRYPVTYEGGPANVEALLVDPITGAKSLVSKALLAGTIYALPATLRTDGANRATVVDEGAPSLVTDGSMTADGRHALLRSYVSASVVDTSTWRSVGSEPLPSQPQGESITIERSDRTFLIGSEGERSALIRLPLTIPETTEPSASPTDPAAIQSPPQRSPGDSDGFAGATWFWAAAVMAMLAAIAVAATKRT
ncbi:hypothetical protein C6I20_12620 [Aeromicrobium sp. A1-2]|uniref:hypothetical protein n=1 Tax=Aeromicrobium sp. A1-2 TaxID=2107713 RepID=UPI000E4A4415|nr:hypothetical protein [Aeromicrobium sp. A1-2]AXT85943.1 hypothetical protein C6I20_12620 [Aeromicrobium sp. A1-2]